MKSERITVLVSPAEKKRINQHAALLDIPVGELIRRACSEYQPEADSAELIALASEFERVVKGTEKKLNTALGKLDEMREFFANQELANQEVDDGRD